MSKAVKADEKRRFFGAAVFVRPTSALGRFSPSASVSGTSGLPPMTEVDSADVRKREQSNGASNQPASPSGDAAVAPEQLFIRWSDENGSARQLFAPGIGQFLNEL